MAKKRQRLGPITRRILREILDSCGFESQSEMARAFRTSDSTISAILSGDQRWNEYWIDKLLKISGLSPDELFSRERLLPAEHQKAHQKLQLILDHAGPELTDVIKDFLEVSASKVQS